MIGRQLGHYRIERKLGEGGMGEVFLASDTKLGRQVALKILSGVLATDPDRLERFEREARAAAALNHPNIVTIHSVENIDGVPFLTLELVDGGTLSEVIPPDGLPLDRVLSLGIALADAIGAAHQRGITHRDLKPANVMVTTDGRVKVLDFGLAKVMEDAKLDADARMATAALTGEGRIVGTVAYMSPEQAEGKPVDPRSDVFSLGIILYEMSTGRRPFEGDTPMATLSAIIKDAPRSIQEVRPGLPRELAKIVGRCLAKDVEDRYQSAKDLRNDLRALKNDLTSGEIVPITGSTERAAVSAAPARGGSVSRLAIVAAIVVVIATAGAATWWMRGPSEPAAPASRPFDDITLSRLTTTGTAGLAAMSLDGRYVAHVSIREGKQSLWLRQIATTSNVEVVPAEEVRYSGVTFSPDGNHIYYSTYARGQNLGILYQIGVLGGGARLVLEDVDTAVSFSPDGRQFAFIRGYPDSGKSGVIVANADGSGARELIARSLPLSFPLEGIAWSPDGRTIAVTGDHADQLRGQVVLVDVASGTETTLAIPEWRAVSRLAWLRDGSGLLVNAQEAAGESSNQIFLVSYPSGTSRRLTNDLSSYSGLGVAPDGRSFVAIRNERRSAIWTLPLEDPAKGAPITTEASADEGTYGIAWTPDGRIVYTTEASGNPDIWIMNADGTRRIQLTSTSGLDVAPRVTPDGRAVVFVSDRDGSLRVWRMALDGSAATKITSEAVGRFRTSLSSDGRVVYYDNTRGEARRVSIDGGDGEPTFAADLVAKIGGLPRGFHEAAPSPDGLTVAGHYQTDRGERIMVVSMGGEAPRKFDTVPASAVWAPDSRSFIYYQGRAGVGNMFRQPLAGGPAAPLTQFTSEQVFTFALSPDQKQLAVVRGRVSSDVVLVSSQEPGRQ
jgi:Tol biopolymer transport system component